MVTPKIELWGNGTLQRTYLFKGLLSQDDRMRQSLLSIPKPFGSYEKRIIANFFGQQRSIRMTFILVPRSDDYTDGTGTYSTGSPEEQKDYLMETIFHNQGKHRFINENGKEYKGKIENIKLDKAGDQPITYEGMLEFSIGDVQLDFFEGLEEDSSS